MGTGKSPGLLHRIRITIQKTRTRCQKNGTAKHSQHPIDALVLGCTHYPIMEPIIQSVMGDSVKLISSGPAVAETVEKFLMENKLQNDGENTPIEAFFVTDFPQKFDELGSQFLGRTLTNVHYIKL